MYHHLLIQTSSGEKVCSCRQALRAEDILNLQFRDGSGVTSADALAPVFQPLFTRQTFCTDENLRSVTLCVFHGCIPPRFHIWCAAYSKAASLCTCGTVGRNVWDALRVSIFVWISFLVSTFLDDISSKPFGIWAQKSGNNDSGKTQRICHTANARHSRNHGDSVPVKQKVSSCPPHGAAIPLTKTYKPNNVRRWIAPHMGSSSHAPKGNRAKLTYSRSVTQYMV